MRYGNRIFIVLFLLGICSPALAHEKRKVGDKEWSVGFSREPAFSGEMNGVDMQIRKKTGEPLTGLQKTLTAEVFYDGEKDGLTVPFRAHANRPWNFEAYFLPDRPGKYRIRIYGTVEGEEVDEMFKSGNGLEIVEDSALWRVPRAPKKEAGK